VAGRGGAGGEGLGQVGYRHFDNLGLVE
jgi:hypothetical protein